MMEADLLPISLVAHTVFCPRRTWLEASGERVSSSQIEAGHSAHRRVNRAGVSGPKHTSVDVHNDALGLVGTCDVVAHEVKTGVDLIEYKATPVRRKAVVTPAQEIQLTLQRLCLVEMGFTVSRMRVYFTDHQTFVDVPHSLELDDRARAAVQETRAILDSSNPPRPLENDDRCRSCSHASVCLPDEILRTHSTRSISASNPDGQILHLTTPGSRAQLRRGRIEVVKGDNELASVPLERVVGMVVHGNVDLSSAVIRELLWRRQSVVWCSGRGRVIGWATSAEAPNGRTRVHQGALSESGCLPLAVRFISSKIANQATQLRRNGAVPPEVVTTMRQLQRTILQSPDLPHVFALEGQAAALYFRWFSTLLRDRGYPFLERWPGRRGRSASDPLNAALNFVYGLLLSDCLRALTACGLDPSAGFLHSSSRNKPALALDLMEEFRTPVAESVVIRAVNTGEISISMFEEAFGDSRLTLEGRKALIEAYEGRVAAAIKHPTFGYSATWRRCIELQARMLLGFLDGSQSHYQGLITR